MSTGYTVRLYYKEPAIWTDVLQGTAAAPAQYRIGVIFLADWLARHTHQASHHALAIIDFAAALVTAAATGAVFFRSYIYLKVEQTAQWFGAAVFCLLILNYLLWLSWYIRPETMTNAALLSLSLLLLTVHLPSRRTVANSAAAAWCAPI